MIKKLLVFTALFLLGACGTNVSSGTSVVDNANTFNVSGVVVDGFISGASVCLDLNVDGSCGIGEPVSVTTANGSFSFSNVTIAKTSVLSIISVGGVDTATGKTFNAELKTTLNASQFQGTKSLYVTPLTDMISTAYFNSDVNDSTKLENSIQKIAVAYRVSLGFIDASPAQYAGVFSITQEILQTISLMEASVIKAKATSFTSLQKRELQRKIKQAIVAQITEGVDINIANVLSKLETLEQISLAQNEKTFIAAQVQEIKLALDAFTQKKNLTLGNLNSYQVALEKEADKIYDVLNNASTGGVINPIVINIDIFADRNVTDANVTDANVTAPDVNESNVTSISFNGVIVDGYIKGATLCLDIDSNGLCASTEPSTDSNERGEFQFSKIEVQKNAIIPIIGFGGVDSASFKTYGWELKNVISTNNANNIIQKVISPLTDLITVDFLSKSDRNSTTYEASVVNVSNAFSLSAKAMQTDPMQNLANFAISQELEHMKRIAEFLIKRHAKPQKIVLQNAIKKELLSQLLETGYVDLSPQRVLIAVELNQQVTVSDNERDFYEKQILEIRRVLKLLVEDENISTFTLPNIQSKLEDSLANVYITAQYKDVNITVESATQSDFSKVNAIYDEFACTLGGIYVNSLSDSNITSLRQEDALNGLSIHSDFNASEINDENQVTLYYPKLESVKTGDNLLVFENQYYFSYDKAWVGLNQSIYVQTPKVVDNLRECYRVKLDSIFPGEINLIKVYRYGS